MHIPPTEENVKRERDEKKAEKRRHRHKIIKHAIIIQYYNILQSVTSSSWTLRRCFERSARRCCARCGRTATGTRAGGEEGAENAKEKEAARGVRECGDKRGGLGGEDAAAINKQAPRSKWVPFLG